MNILSFNIILQYGYVLCSKSRFFTKQPSPRFGVSKINLMKQVVNPNLSLRKSQLVTLYFNLKPRRLYRLQTNDTDRI